MFSFSFRQNTWIAYKLFVDSLYTNGVETSMEGWGLLHFVWAD